MNAIVLVCDRLHAGYLGCYGNTWIETPALDQLAVESFVFDQCLVGSPSLDDFYRGAWQGLDPLLPGSAAEDVSLAGLVASRAAATLASDAPAICGHPLAAGFGEVVEIDPCEAERPVESSHETHLARLFARLVDWLDGARPRFLLWCHLRGLGGRWEAPLGYRRRYCEPGDPEPWSAAEVPGLVLPPDADPDEALRLRHAYAGQVSLLDECLGGLLEFVDSSPLAPDTLLAVTSARGFPLGEHRRVGPVDDALYGELVQAPLMVRMPGGVGAAGRSQALVTPADLFATLLECWGLPPPGPTPGSRSLLPLVREEAEAVRDRLCMVHADSERAIRTPAWHLRECGQPELFAKPDDRWEVNNAADRCPEVVERLSSAYDRYRALLLGGRLDELEPLDPVLIEGVE